MVVGDVVGDVLDTPDFDSEWWKLLRDLAQLAEMQFDGTFGLRDFADRNLLKAVFYTV